MERFDYNKLGLGIMPANHFKIRGNLGNKHKELPFWLPAK